MADDALAAGLNAPTGAAQPATTTPVAPAPSLLSDAAAKAADAAKLSNEPAVPIKYELKVPENVKLDASVIDETVAFAKEQGLSAEQAQKVLDRDLARDKAKADALAADNADFVKELAVEANADKEIGGIHLAANVQAARTVIEKYGNDQIKGFLDTTGLGNNVEVIRMLSKIGKAMAEPTTVVPQTSAAGIPPKRSHADILYSSTPSK